MALVAERVEVEREVGAVARGVRKTDPAVAVERQAAQAGRARVRVARRVDLLPGCQEAAAVERDRGGVQLVARSDRPEPEGLAVRRALAGARRARGAEEAA